METTNNIATSETESPKKTAVLSVSVITLDTVLALLHAIEIEHKTLATDQESKTILQVTYKEDQQKQLNDLVHLMNFLDEAVALFIPLLKTTLTELQDKSENLLQELIKKYEARKPQGPGNLSTQLKEK